MEDKLTIKSSTLPTTSQNWGFFGDIEDRWAGPCELVMTAGTIVKTSGLQIARDFFVWSDVIIESTAGPVLQNWWNLGTLNALSVVTPSPEEDQEQYVIQAIQHSGFIQGLVKKVQSITLPENTELWLLNPFIDTPEDSTELYAIFPNTLKSQQLLIIEDIISDNLLLPLNKEFDMFMSFEMLFDNEIQREDMNASYIQIY